MVKIYKQPFAHGGDSIAIPDSSQPDGKMSSADGWTPDYQLPKTDPNYKPVGRQEMNGVFKEVTEAIGDIQLTGIAKWSTDATPYPAGAVVWHNSVAWLSDDGNNSSVPGEGGDWSSVASASGGGSQSLVNNGYQIQPGGLTIQWGQGESVAGTTKLNDFPIAFPNACFSVVCTANSAGSEVNAIPIAIGSKSTTGFYAKTSDGSSFDYIAIGY